MLRCVVCVVCCIEALEAVFGYVSVLSLCSEQFIAYAVFLIPILPKLHMPRYSIVILKKWAT